MENFLIYIGKSAIAAGAFYIVFLLLFQNRKQFVFNRIYVPVSLALSFIIPLITFTTVKYVEPTPAPDFSNFAYLADTTEIHTPPAFELEWYHYLFGIYLLGAAGFLFHLLLGHFKAISIIRKSRIQKLFENLVNITKKDVHPFSFFNKIVLSEKTLSHPNLDIIVSHENIHVKEKHTLDILFTEILFLIQWFNPFAWLIKDAVKNNLEYKTDHEIAKTTNPKTYQLAMVTLADKQGVAPFLTALNGSQLKNRIIMMKKKTENKYALLKQLVVLPLLAVLIMGLSNKEVKTEISHSDISVYQNVIEGKVTNINGEPIAGVSILINGTREGTKTDIEGGFEINSKEKIEKLFFGKSGYKEQNVNISVQKNLNVTLKVEDRLYIVDGIEAENIEEINPNDIESVDVLKGESAKKLYREKGKNGVVVITTKQATQKEKKFEISGKVTDKNGDPISGVSIIVKEKTIGTITDSNGNYKLGLNEKNEALAFSKSEYKTKDVHVNGKNKINIELVANKNTKKENVNAISYGKPGTTGIVNAHSRAANTTFLTDNIQGDKPIFVVNGVEMENISYLNPENIKSVNVLKDKYATDLYGEKAKNGAVLITTKEPEKFNFGNPVVIVDGQEYDSMEDAEVPPEDIASIDVLKGKSATDLYGEKGKNGVIQIITKGSKEIPKGELPIVLNGKMTELTLNEVDRDLIHNIKRIEPEEALKKYGERGKNGVFEVTSRNVYTDKVKVNSSEEITTSLELRKLIANKIKYPVAAQKNNITGTVKLWAVVEYDGKITHIYEKEPKGNIENLDEVVVIGYSTPKPKSEGTNTEAASSNKNNVNSKTSSELTSLLTNEVKRVMSTVPAIDIPELQGKTLEFTVTFMLQ